MATASSRPQHSRYVFIDALRGIAAVSVVLHHLLHSTDMEVVLRRILPDALILVSDYGAYGVQIFFVLSGFVIAHSLRDNPLTRHSIGNFILRRQLRLDPPYWIMLLVALGLHRLELAMPGLVTKPMPRPVEVLANVLYLQNIFRFHLPDIFKSDQVLSVGWTLCIEIQFYLVFIFLLGVGSRGAKAIKRAEAPIFAVLLIVTGCLSLVVSHLYLSAPWFIHYWFYFAAGVLCYWAVRQSTSQWVFLGFMAAFSLSAFLATLHDAAHPSTLDAGTIEGLAERSASGTAMMIGLLTLAAIYLVGRKERLTEWLSNSLLQYLGRISYSLYLTHLLVVSLILRLGYKVTGQNTLMAAFWFVFAGAVSIGIAQLFFMAVERPSMHFASRFKLSHATPPAAPIDASDDSESGFATETDDLTPSPA